MLTFESTRGVRCCDGLTRRDFLRAGSLSAGAVGLSLADLAGLRANGPASRSADINVILLFLVGAPSHLDTWDPKPSAPANVRGPFQPIRTNVNGIHLGEHFPRMAQRAHRFALVRSVHHTAAPIHETGHQLMQTGHLFKSNREYPHYGAVLSHLRGRTRNGLPPFVVLPEPIGNTGVNISHGQTAGFLGARHQPLVLSGDPALAGFRVSGLDPARPQSRGEVLSAIDEAQRVFETAGNHRPADEVSEAAFRRVFASNTRRAFDLSRESEQTRDRYGRNTFGQSCLLARRLVEHGVQLATVNMFDTVFNRVTWDCHADGGSLASNLNDYKDTLCPMFDLAYTALLDDLHERGLLATTLVVAMGEFGRTPQINGGGGRDHWPGVWTILFAGAGVTGGQVIGASDRIGAEPKDRPVTPAEVTATIYRGVGIDLKTRLPGPDGRAVPLTEAAPIHELFRG
jgi:uncharacterized protein (DUF1501 family)